MPLLKPVLQGQGQSNEIERELFTDCVCCQRFDEKSIVPVLEKLEVSNIKLLHGFANSDKQQRQARGLGLADTHIKALVSKYKQPRFHLELIGVDVVNDLNFQSWKHKFYRFIYAYISSTSNSNPNSILAASIKTLTLAVLVILILTYVVEIFIFESEANPFRARVERFTDRIGNPYEHHICNATSLSVANLRLRESEDGRIGAMKTNYSFESKAIGNNNYIHRLKVAENGILCINENKNTLLSSGWGENFTQELDSLMHGLWHARILKRTLVTTSLISSLYDVETLGRSMYPSEDTAVVLPHSTRLCDSDIDSHNISALTLTFAELYVPDFIFIRAFHQYLVPTGTIEPIIKGYIYEHFGLSPFAALWLVDDAQRCKKTTSDSILCSPTRDLVGKIMNQLMPESPVPLFVFTKSQNGVPKSFQRDHHIDVPCPPHACAMIQREIAGKSKLKERNCIVMGLIQY
mmetsp:Transcript_138/g.223  ORF Transcript_138/g.223 Transcript_138/m.223 type:complete len:464 (+) Transcript_138:140-1531(+)